MGIVLVQYNRSMKSFETRGLNVPIIKFMLLVLLSHFGSYVFCYGQSTYYYRQEKIIDRHSKQVRNGDNNQSGMFITFNKKGCYDSDSEGYDAGNGFREEVSRNTKFITYIGTSYWGDAEFIATVDKSRINIRTADRIYVYARTNAPSGKKDSSLKRNRNGAGIVPMPSNGGMITIDGGSQDKETLRTMYMNTYSRYESSLKSAIDAYERSMNDSYDSSRAGMGVNIRNIQAEMRKLRYEAQRKGIHIPASSWESVQPRPETYHYESK